MKFIKWFVGIIIGLVVLGLLIPVFIKTKYEVERQTVINKDKTYVFNFIKLLKNQDKYSVWQKRDPDMEKEYHGTDGKVGFIVTWKSKDEEVGAGEQEIVDMIDGERVDYELRFFSPFEAVSPAYMLTEDNSDGKTIVKWGFKGKMDYPSNLLFLFIDFEKEIGKDFQEGLNNLKRILENNGLEGIEVKR